MAHPTIRSFPLAYHVRLRAYATWLPGDPRGWYRRGDDPASPRPESPVLRAICRERQRDPMVVFDAATGGALVESMRALCEREAWRLHAVAVDSSHLHAVLQAPLAGVDLIRTIKEHTERDLLATGLHHEGLRFWSESVFFVMVTSERHLTRAVAYVRRHRSV